MAKKYPIEDALEKATKRIAKEFSWLIRALKTMIKFFFERPKTKNEVYIYIGSTIGWQLLILAFIYMIFRR